MDWGFFQKPRAEKPKRSVQGDLLTIRLRSPEVALLNQVAAELKFKLQAIEARVSGPVARKSVEDFRYPVSSPGSDPVIRNTTVHIRQLTVSGLTQNSVKELSGWDLPGGVEVEVVKYTRGNDWPTAAKA